MAYTSFVFLIGSEDPNLYSTSEVNQGGPRNIRLDDVIRLAENDPLWANRGKAIQGYAQLESSLSHLLAHMGDMPMPNASTIFYRMTNAASRSAVLERLLHRKHGRQFDPFWKNYFRQLRTLDGRRNEIVHWLATANAILDDNNVLHVGVTLIHPDRVGDAKDAEMRTSKDLIAFHKTCDEFARLASVFIMTVNPPADDDPAKRQSWLDIFQRPFVYPLPEDHPIRRIDVTPDTPPQSSPP